PKSTDASNQRFQRPSSYHPNLTLFSWRSWRPGGSIRGNPPLNLNLPRRFGIVGHFDGRTPDQRLDAAGPRVVLTTIEERELNAHLRRTFGDCAQRHTHGKLEIF